MPRYRVTVHRPSVETVEAANPYMAAAAVVERFGDGTTVTDVRPATGRPAGSTVLKKTAARKAPAKKRKPLSPEARARLAENLKKARAARARNLKAAKKTPAKKAKRSVKKR